MSWRKISFAAAILIGTWFLFGNAAPASAGEGEACTWTASSSQYMSDHTNWLNEGTGLDCTFASTSTVALLFKGTVTNADAIWDAGLEEVTNVSIYEVYGYTGTVTMGAGAATTSGWFLQETGTVNFTGTGALNVGGNFTITSGTFYGATSSAVTMYGSSKTLTVSSTAVRGDASFRNLTINSAGTVTLGSNVTTTNLTITSGNISNTLDLSTYNLIVSGDLVNSSIITQTSGTVTMTGDNATLGGESNATTLYNLIISGTTTTLANDIVISNNLTVNSGSTLNLSTYTVTVTGNLANSGTVIQSAGTVTMNGANATLGASGGNTTLYNLSVGGTLVTLADDISVTNNIQVDTSMTFALATYNVTVGGGFPNSGTISQTSGTVTMTGTGNVSGTKGPTQFFALTLSGTGTVTLAGNLTVSSTVTVGAGTTLALAGRNLTVASNLTNAGTVTQSAGTVTMEGTNALLGSTGNTTLYNLTISGATTTLAGNVTSTNVLTISANKELKAGGYTLTLSGSGTPLVTTGLFTINTSTVRYTGTGLVTSTAASYYDLYFGTGTYFFSDSATSSNSFTNNGTTTIWTDKYLYAPVTFDNNGTITETGAIKHPVTSAKLTNSSGTEVVNFGTDAVYVTVTDSDGNLSNTVADTITGSVVNADPYGDSETVTLTETGVDTGIFRSSAINTVVAAGASHGNGQLEVSGDHSLSLAFADSKESADTGSDTSLYSESTYNSGGGSSGGSSYVPPVVPVVVATSTVSTTPTTSTTPTNSAVPATPASSVTVPVSITISAFSTANPDSTVVFSNITKIDFKPGDMMKFKYQYKNNETKKVQVRVVRQLINPKGKVIFTAQAWPTLKAGASFNGNVNQYLSKSLANGIYTVKVKITDLKNKILDENSFEVKVWKKYFTLDNMNLGADLIWDAKIWSQVKSNVLLPTNIKLRYIYTNTADKQQTIKMVRELIDATGKVKEIRSGKWIVEAGESDSFTFNQWLSGSLSEGHYLIRVRAYDWNTKAVLADNNAGFTIDLK